MSGHGFPDGDLSPFQQCPQCTSLIEGEAKACRVCGYEIARHTSSADDATLNDSLFANAEPLAGDVPPVMAGDDAQAPPPSASGLAPRMTTRRVRESHPVSKWSVPVMGAAGFLAIVAAVLAFGWLHAQTPETTVVPQAVAAASPRPAPIVQAPPPQKWLGRRQATWARDGSKTITFELQASQDVPVWMASARPQLVVRCLSRTTEVYVSLGSAASLEAQTGVHTVRIQIDDDPEVQQQWSDSDSSQELFAPDGPALTRRLATARHMRFGFTPFNANPVVADFSVQGFDELAPLVANSCGWRLDDAPVSHAPRSARLK